MINLNTSLDFSHFPVMLDEVIKICSPKKGGVFIDCTFGGGGYSKKLLKFSKTQVIALDRDKYILKIAKELEKKYPNRFSFFQKKFSEIDSISNKQQADVILFDLGLSSIQLNDLTRGIYAVEFIYPPNHCKLIVSSLDFMMYFTTKIITSSFKRSEVIVIV